MKTYSSEGEIDENGLLKLTFSTDLPAGPVDVVVTVSPREPEIDSQTAKKISKIRIPSDNELVEDLNAVDDEIRRKAADNSN